MAKFFGPIGFAHSDRSAPGITEEIITEKSYFGDEVRGSRQLVTADRINPDITVSTQLSIMADAWAAENIFAMRYIKWAGSLWIIENAIPERPRILLTLGGVYNGPTASPPGDPGGDGGDG